MIFSTIGSVAQGVQQPFEISIITELESRRGSILYCNVFPNPTNNSLTLIIEENTNNKLSYQLYNLNGILLESNRNIESNSNISTLKYKETVLILKVLINNIEIKTFKIIKKS